jgi:hypothetical protein
VAPRAITDRILWWCIVLEWTDFGGVDEEESGVVKCGVPVTQSTIFKRKTKLGLGKKRE